MFSQSVFGRKRISPKEYDKLSDEDKQKFKFQLLDSDFSPGPGDDISFTWRVHKAGFKIYIADFWVDHHRQTENFYDNVELIKMRNAGYFRKKHNIKPEWVEYDLNGDKFLLDSRTFTCYGCFKEKGKLDDKETLMLIQELTKDYTDDDTVIDVGANTGMMSLAVQHAQVFAYEPTPETYDILKTNAIINEWKNIIPVLAAVHDTKQKYLLGYANIKNPDGLPIYWSGLNNIKIDDSGKLETITLDDELDKYSNVKLIKIDTEGNDLNVLKGASKLLKKYSPMLITEQVSKHESYLTDLGYHVVQEVGINFLWSKE